MKSLQRRLLLLFLSRLPLSSAALISMPSLRASKTFSSIFCNLKGGKKSTFFADVDFLLTTFFLYGIICLQINHLTLVKEETIMEAILAFVQELLTHLKEFDAAAIIEIIKNFFAGLA